MWGSLQGQAAGFDCKAFLDQGRTRTSSRGSRSKLQPGKQKVEVHWLHTVFCARHCYKLRSSQMGLLVWVLLASRLACFCGSQDADRNSKSPEKEKEASGPAFADSTRPQSLQLCSSVKPLEEDAASQKSGKSQDKSSGDLGFRRLQHIHNFSTCQA